ncbi:MAG: glycosyltransferase family 39 protein [Candidatus Magasanikbacteria bacterium]|nr:glycosyltransferase family 39 protein [Candidatus Magasanikbacteria bacterium]
MQKNIEPSLSNIKKWSTLLHIDNHFFVLFIFLVTALIIYYPIFDFTFFQDDFVWISHAKDIWGGSAQIFTLKISHFVMPMVYGYFALAFKIFGLHSTFFYLVNILIHVMNSYLLFCIIKKLLPQHIAFFSSSIFLVLRYPLEAVSWISAVTVLLTTLLLLLAGLSWIYFVESNLKLYYALTFIFCILLIFTKEWSILVIPFCILFYILIQLKRQQPIWSKKYFLYFLPILIMFGIYLGYESVLQRESSVLITQGFYMIGWHALPNCVNNILLTFIPFTKLVHAEPMVWLTASTIFLITGLVAGLYIYIKTKNPLGIGLVWMIISFIPTSFFTWDPYVSRYAYIPTIGAVLYIGYGLKILQDLKLKKWIIHIAYSVLLVYGLVNILFTHRVLHNLYKPIHDENKLFTEALYQIEPRLQKNEDIAIYHITPHKFFILPEILHTLIDVDPQKIHVPQNIEECMKYSQCLFWNSETKIIELL